MSQKHNVITAYYLSTTMGLTVLEIDGDKHDVGDVLDWASKNLFPNRDFAASNFRLQTITAASNEKP